MNENHPITLNGQFPQVNQNIGPGTINVYNNTMGRTMYQASSDLRSWYSYIYKDKHINRKETRRLLDWIESSEVKKRDLDRVMLLVGDAGTGKSVVMKDLLETLEERNIPVLGLKADMLFSNNDKIDNLVGLGKPVVTAIGELEKKGKVVLLVDQIDALSSTLSSNRMPLHTVNTLVAEVCKMQNVRVVVSCRPYDQQYDPTLERYGNGRVIRMEGLPEDEVNTTLELAGIQVDDSEKDVKNFLSNPLNLFLFCRVRNGQLFSGKSPNTTLLYEALWKQVVIDGATAAELVDTAGVKRCLDTLVSKMYERQILSIPYNSIGAEYPHEVSYLRSNNILCDKSENNQVQFIHQSLYDYVYARLFQESGKTITDILEGVHQGLFIRLRLKQVLFYLRDVDEDQYLDNLRCLIFDKDEKGKDKYRFHLKHLMLSNLGFLNSMSKKEKAFIRRCVLENTEYADIFIDSIFSEVCLEAYIGYVNDKGGYESLNEEERLQLINACERTARSGSLLGLSYLDSISMPEVGSVLYKRILGAVSFLDVTEDNLEILLRLANKLEKGDDSLELSNLYRHLIKYKADYVAEKIVRYTDSILKQYDDKNPYNRLNFGYKLDSLLDEMKEKNPAEAYVCVLQIIKNACEVSAYGGEGISGAGLFMGYERGGHHGSFVENQLTYILKRSDAMAKGKQDEFANILKGLSGSDKAELVLIAVSAYMANINEYIDEAYNVSMRMLKEEHSSPILDYYAKELFNQMFPLLDKGRQDCLMSELEKYSPKWEKTRLVNSINSPMTEIGYSRAEYYAQLSEEVIAHYPMAKKQLQETRRIHPYIHNTEPFRTSTRSGWTSLTNEKYDNMTVAELVKVMVEISSDIHLDWDQPTKTGNALAIKRRIAKRPKDVYDAYMLALNDERLDLDYPLYGIEELVNTDLTIDAIVELVDKLVNRYDADLKKNTPSHLIQVSRLLDPFFKKGVRIPESLFNLVCRIATEWDDAEYKDENGDGMSYNDGINQVRGCAAEALLRCYADRDRSERLFDVFSAIAQNGSVPTRASLLFRLGVMFYVDKEKTLSLFLSLIRDYKTSLLNIPVHNQNVLMFLINDFFEELKPYFEACIENEASHAVNVEILWIAWVRQKAGAEELTYKMADKSETARSSLLNAIERFFDMEYAPCIMPVLYRYLKYNEENTGKSYDLLFHDCIDRIPKQEQHKFVIELVESPIICFCVHSFIEYLGRISTTDPEFCLSLLPKVYASKGDEQIWAYNDSKLIDCLITSYNSIKEYDKSNPILEQAMDLLDEWLHNNDTRQYMFNCFKLLDN